MVFPPGFPLGFSMFLMMSSLHLLTPGLSLSREVEANLDLVGQIVYELPLGKKFDTVQITNTKHSHRNTCLNLFLSLIIKPKLSIMVMVSVLWK